MLLKYFFSLYKFHCWISGFSRRPFWPTRIEIDYHFELSISFKPTSFIESIDTIPTKMVVVGIIVFSLHHHTKRRQMEHLLKYKWKYYLHTDVSEYIYIYIIITLLNPNNLYHILLTQDSNDNYWLKLLMKNNS